MDILDKALRVAKWAACAAVVLMGFYYASRMDYEDAVLNEMKNNGTYYTMSQETPIGTRATWLRCMMLLRSNAMRKRAPFVSVTTGATEGFANTGLMCECANVQMVAFGG